MSLIFHFQTYLEAERDKDRDIEKEAERQRSRERHTERNNFCITFKIQILLEIRKDNESANANKYIAVLCLKESQNSLEQDDKYDNRK